MRGGLMLNGLMLSDLNTAWPDEAGAARDMPGRQHD